MWPFKKKAKKLPIVGETYRFAGRDNNPFKEDPLVGAKVLEVSSCGGYVKYVFVRSSTGVQHSGSL